ncbi:hypothetical protein AVEN_240673-1 [Araneus ventricosus]|uniref:CCHC-type domain-containing protein n=1 Tax=Araneus ventricosus TaxID=182803 RepID=A0A4Y2D603_ARAVE|nr:hypothetical protein AVEN_240673-1 [Araneus ventricosus]
MGKKKSGPFSGQQIASNSSNFPTFFLIKRVSTSDESFHSVSPFLVEKAITGSIGDVKSTKKLRSGDLLVEVQSRKQSEQILKIKKISTIPITVSPHASLNSSKGVITCGELLNVPTEEILTELQGQGVSHVRRISIRRDGQLLNTKHLILTFDSAKLPENIKAGYMRLSVRTYIPNPLRCFQCQRFGHSKTSCRGTLTCARCAEVGHESTDCTRAEKNLASPDLTDFTLVKSRKKLKKDSPNKTSNTIPTAEKISKFYTTSHREVRNPVPAKDNISTRQSVLKPLATPKTTSVDTELLPMAVLPPLEKALLQSRESDADAEMSSSSLSEEDALEYDMSEDLEDSLAGTSPPPSSKPQKADKYKNSSKPPDSIARASPPVNNFPISSSPSVAPVSEEALASPDFTDFKLVSNKKKLKRDSPTKTNNSIAKAEKISKFYTSSRREVLNTVPTKDNICTHQSALKPFETKKHTSVDIELLPMAVLPPLEQTVLQSRESDADAEMSSSSLSEEDALEYDMSEDLEDSPAVISPPPFSKPEKGDKYKNRTIGSGINMLGKEKVSRTFNKTEVQAYVAAIGAVPQVVSEYNQMIMNSKMYHREAYTRAGKTDNTVVKISAGDDISNFVKI